MKKTFLFSIIFVVCCFEILGMDSYHNVLAAAKDAESFLVVKINKKQQVDVFYFLPSQLQNPTKDTIYKTLANFQPGIYIFPVKHGNLLKFAFPYLVVKNPESTYSLLLRFKQLPQRDESHFLISNFLNHDQPFRLAALKRMLENGFFNLSFDANTVVYFKNFYTQTKLSIPEKRLLLENFAVCNFNKMTDLYILALSDQSVAKLAGRIFYSKNQVLFSDIVKKYISNDALWKVAIKQSEFFVTDKEFINQAMQRFDHKNPQKNSADFVPLLFSQAKNQYRNDEVIKRLLTNSKNTKSFDLYRNLAYWLNHSETIKFKDEIIQFVVNNKKNHYIYDSIVYPTMLSALKKSGHPLANKLLFEYFSDLKVRNNKQLIAWVCILFKEKNQPNPSLDSLLSGLKELF